MAVKVVLVDINTNMVRAWREAFADHPEVEIVHGSLLAQSVSAWVSPTNSRGNMDGGVDGAVRGTLGSQIQTKVKREINERHGGSMPVGYATCVPTGRSWPRYLISTPTMSAASPIRDTLNVALACCAAFQAISLHNRFQHDDIVSVALPGLGTGTGRVPVEVCADLMWTAYNLFREQVFDSFEEMRAALEAEVGSLPASTTSMETARALRGALFAQSGIDATVVSP